MRYFYRIVIEEQDTPKPQWKASLYHHSGVLSATCDFATESLAKRWAEAYASEKVDEMKSAELRRAKLKPRYQYDYPPPEGEE